MNVDVLDESGEDCDVASLARLSRFVMRRMRLHPSTELCVRMVTVETITHLNEHWMDSTGPTDVLSFPMDELRPGPLDGPLRCSVNTGEDSDAAPPYLGDIALCPTIASRQAHESDHAADQEVDLLLVHGILHLLGYDHAEPEEHAQMFGLQRQLLEEWQTVRTGATIE